MRRDREKQARRTADVNGVETNRSHPNQNLVLPYFRGGGFLENDILFLVAKVRFEMVRFPS